MNYGPKIVTNGLVLHVNAADRKSYPGSGATWFDLSGNNLHATINNSPTFSGDTGGKFNINAYNSNKNFNFPVSSLLNFQSSNFSFCFFWKPGYDWIISGGQYIPLSLESSYGMGYNQSAYEAFALNFQTYTGGVWTATRTADYRAYYNVWHLTTVVRNGSSVRIYANTTDVTSIASTHGNPTSQTTYGLYLASDRLKVYTTVCDGDYSAFMAYNKALSITEITQNFNAYRRRFSL